VHPQARVRSVVLDYRAAQLQNWDVFLLNFPDDFKRFETAIADTYKAWEQVSKRRDAQGRSHVGLLMFPILSIRQFMTGFQHIAAHQAFLAWSTLRPGLEAFLFLGKWIDDPANAEIWRNRTNDRDAYRKVFEGKALISAALPNAAVLRRVLTRLNDDFMHPNPTYSQRELRVRDEGQDTVLLNLSFFDVESELHEAHLLAFVNLADFVANESIAVVNKVLNLTPESGMLRRDSEPYDVSNAERGRALVAHHPEVRTILVDYGNWDSELLPAV
jgi:hypothetical protein